MARRVSPFHSIRGKLIILFLVFVLLPTLIIFWSYTRSTKEVIAGEVYAANQELADRSAKSANDVATRMINAMSLLESSLLDYYESDLSNWSVNYPEFNKIVAMQRRMTSIRDLLLDVNSFFIFTDFGELAVSTLDSFDMKWNASLLRQEEWFLQAKAYKGFPQWFMPFRLDRRIGHTVTFYDGGYLALARSLHDQRVFADFGALLVGVRMDTVFEQSDNGVEGFLPKLLLWDGQDGVSDSQGKRVKTLNEEEIAELRDKSGQIKRLGDGRQNYIVNVSRVPELGISVLHLESEKQFIDQLEQKQSRSILSFTVVISIGIAVFVFFLIRFTKPITALVHSMSRVGTGNFQTSVEVRGNDEIALLAGNFNRMVTRLSELMERLNEEQRQKEEANFQSLQAQINPHFLFNTLNSIKLMAMLSNTNRNVSDMITALGKLLEFSMKFQQRHVTLAQEIEYLELYMLLQKIRYQDQIDLDIHVPEQLKEIEVLKFSLQPIIENSIIHGGRLPLAISISAEAAEDGLLVTVRDNGNGVTREQLAEMRDKLEQPDAKYSGIGISNVDRRIRLYCGASYGITLRSIESGGLEVQIKFPLRKEQPS